jgi:tetratricopeptide (TPR) repeat protein
VKADYDWDWPGAEREFRRPIDLNPGYATAHQWYAEILSELGRHEEALAEIKRAQQLDPFSLIINAVSGDALRSAGKDDLAIEQLRETLKIDQTCDCIRAAILSRIESNRAGVVQWQNGSFPSFGRGMDACWLRSCVAQINNSTNGQASLAHFQQERIS